MSLEAPETREDGEFIPFCISEPQSCQTFICKQEALLPFSPKHISVSLFPLPADHGWTWPYYCMSFCNSGRSSCVAYLWVQECHENLPGALRQTGLIKEAERVPNLKSNLLQISWYNPPVNPNHWCLPKLLWTGDCKDFVSDKVLAKSSWSCSSCNLTPRPS